MYVKDSSKLMILVLSVPVTILGIVLALYAILAAVITLLFGFEIWFIGEKVEERKVYLEAKPDEYFIELLEASKELIEARKVIDSDDYVFDLESDADVISTIILDLKPQSMRYYSLFPTLRITLDRHWYVMAELRFSEYKGGYEVIGFFGEAGDPTAEEITFFSEIDSTIIE